MMIRPYTSQIHNYLVGTEMIRPLFKEGLFSILQQQNLRPELLKP